MIRKRIKTPSFWYKPHVTWQAKLLLPLTHLWRFGAKLRNMRVKPYRSTLKVLCVGNITSGGSGKTPLISALVAEAKKRGYNPIILTKGYGGSFINPTLVKPEMDARFVGDEAVMLAKDAPVVVAKNRAEAAKWIENFTEHDLILMDDGMQNLDLEKDIQLAVFNGRLGIGNALLMPAGPMRESLESGLEKTHAVVMTGKDKTNLAKEIKQLFPKMPTATATRSFDKKTLRRIGKKPAIAFAAIADPEGFFLDLKDAGINLVNSVAYPDHAPISTQELDRLTAIAKAQNAVLITTEKDTARLGSHTKDVITICINTSIKLKLLDEFLPPKRRRKTPA